MKAWAARSDSQELTSRLMKTPKLLRVFWSRRIRYVSVHFQLVLRNDVTLKAPPPPPNHKGRDMSGACLTWLGERNSLRAQPRACPNPNKRRPSHTTACMCNDKWNTDMPMQFTFRSTGLKIPTIYHSSNDTEIRTQTVSEEQRLVC
jgi:hypothetical protein